MEAYVRSLFDGDPNVTLEVVSGRDVLEREYPCLAAVNRGSVERHEGRVIWITYEPPKG